MLCRAMARPAISVEKIRVRFGERTVIEDVSFAVDAGEIVGLLGPNGAGKTTTLSVLSTLVQPQAGTATVAGHRVDRDSAEVRRVIGRVPQSIALYPTMTARENAQFFARLSGLPRSASRRAADDVLALVGLEDRADEIVATYSGGMQRRLNLACGLVNAPSVILLDEPTVGVDPQSRERIFAAVQTRANAGAAVLYSTHYLEEAERLCDRVVLIDHGRVVASGAPSTLVRGLRDGLHIDVVTVRPVVPGWLDGLAGVRSGAYAGGGENGKSLRGNAVRVHVEHLESVAHVLERAATDGNEVLEFHVEQPSLQDVFLSLTGRGLRD